MSAVTTHISVVPGSEAFPLLTPAQIERLRAHGKLRHVEAGEVLFEPGDSNMRNGKIERFDCYPALNIMLKQMCVAPDFASVVKRSTQH